MNQLQQRQIIYRWKRGRRQEGDLPWGGEAQTNPYLAKIRCFCDLLQLYLKSPSFLLCLFFFHSKVPCFIYERCTLKEYELANILTEALLAAEITDNFLAVIHNLYQCLWDSEAIDFSQSIIQDHIHSLLDICRNINWVLIQFRELLLVGHSLLFVLEKIFRHLCNLDEIFNGQPNGAGICLCVFVCVCSYVINCFPGWNLAEANFTWAVIIEHGEWEFFLLLLQLLFFFAYPLIWKYSWFGWVLVWLGCFSFHG